MATFRPSVEQWRPLVQRMAPDLPIDFLMAFLDEESGGNPCSTGIPNVEAGLFQTFHPHDDRFGATFAQLRANCSGSTVIAPLSDDQQTLHVVSGVNLVRDLIQRARSALGSVGAIWPESSTDFWNFVKLGHGLPAMQTDLMRVIVGSLGRAPLTWTEFRNAAMSLPPNQYPASLINFALAPSKAGRRNRIEDVLANAEHAGRFGGGLPLVGLAALGLAGAAALLYLIWRRRR